MGIHTLRPAVAQVMRGDLDGPDTAIGAKPPVWFPKTWGGGGVRCSFFLKGYKNSLKWDEWGQLHDQHREPALPHVPSASFSTSCPLPPSALWLDPAPVPADHFQMSSHKDLSFSPAFPVRTSGLSVCWVFPSFFYLFGLQRKRAQLHPLLAGLLWRNYLTSLKLHLPIRKRGSYLVRLLGRLMGIRCIIGVVCKLPSAKKKIIQINPS